LISALRSLVTAIVFASTLTASAADQKTFPLNGAWVFDSAPSFPGVTTHGAVMLKVRGR
jgi:hypothetical protein